jgi:hypothetical protein
VSDKTWKQLERDCARLIGGYRMPANVGGKIDVTSERYFGQCKLLSIDTHVTLPALSKIVQELDEIAAKEGKRGVVFVKMKAGKGHPTPILVVQSAAAWKEEHRDEG